MKAFYFPKIYVFYFSPCCSILNNIFCSPNVAPLATEGFVTLRCPYFVVDIQANFKIIAG